MESEPEQYLCCGSGGLLAPPEPMEIEVVYVDADSPVALVQENLTVNERSFDPAAAEVSAQDAERFRAQLADCVAVTVRHGGGAVAGGMRLPVRDGRAELVGIGTLAGHRRRGYGAVVTDVLARNAFACGARLVFMTTDNPDARRVYERVGFVAGAAAADG